MENKMEERCNKVLARKINQYAFLAKDLENIIECSFAKGEKEK